MNPVRLTLEFTLTPHDQALWERGFSKTVVTGRNDDGTAVCQRFSPPKRHDLRDTSLLSRLVYVHDKLVRLGIDLEDANQLQERLERAVDPDGDLDDLQAIGLVLAGYRDAHGLGQKQDVNSPLAMGTISRDDCAMRSSAEQESTQLPTKRSNLNLLYRILDMIAAGCSVDVLEVEFDRSTRAIPIGTNTLPSARELMDEFVRARDWLNR